ncbi:hypothetical protein E2C01_095278 [Portunus trituberculatus]|uniref:Uncharacterized protein n=1 Tax=Portunus trituberculatus TaxID=210409 RepID=A0A5B7K3E1_PORTR|nr:hypothetical protein [Portunus trituberculatus]
MVVAAVARQHVKTKRHPSSLAEGGSVCVFFINTLAASLVCTTREAAAAASPRPRRSSETLHPSSLSTVRPLRRLCRPCALCCLPNDAPQSPHVSATSQSTPHGRASLPRLLT